MQGFLGIMKPPGMTSSDVVGFVRHRVPRGIKVGHAGTLDPAAAGVLPLMLGKATRLFDDATAGEKEYIAALRFGIATDTQDATGRVTGRSDARPGDGALRAALASFVGEIEQIPPSYSALKQDGRPLYELARAGQAVQKPPRRVTIPEIELLERNSPEEALLRVVCGKGTYIRTLCYDIGRRLGCPAHMGMLIRTRAGIFTLEGAHPLEEITPEALPGLLLPMDAPLGHLPPLHALPGAAHACRNGNPLPAALLRQPLPELGARARVYLEDDFIGIARVEGDHAVFEAMLKTWEDA